MTPGSGGAGLEFAHTPVMLQEVVEQFPAAAVGGHFVDATLGGAGHTEIILQRHRENRVLGIDRDIMALQAAAIRLQPYLDRVQLVQANFADMSRVLSVAGIDLVDGVLFDLGVSSPQLDQIERGFSYQHDAPLDMRMDTAHGMSAAQLLNKASEGELTRILREYGEERWAPRIAAFIVEARRRQPVNATGELEEIIKNAIPAAARRSGPHPARRTFQALRIAVNDELGSLAAGLAAALESLRPGGRMAVISFHSLEDRIVKQFYRQAADPCTCPKDLPACVCGRKPSLRVITPKGLTPSQVELADNPRSRSARLRVAERVLRTEVDA